MINREGAGRQRDTQKGRERHTDAPGKGKSRGELETEKDGDREGQTHRKEKREREIAGIDAERDEAAGTESMEEGMGLSAEDISLLQDQRPRCPGWRVFELGPWPTYQRMLVTLQGGSSCC